MGREQQPLLRLLYTNRKLQQSIDFNKTIDPVASSVLYLKLQLINTLTSGGNPQVICAKLLCMWGKPM